jgi:VWFA-related protein
MDGYSVGQDMTPVFRSGTRLVEVNVVARDRNGPVAGLSKDDFTLLEDGKPRAIGTFSMIAGRAPTALAAAPGQSRRDSGLFTNRPDQSGENASTATILLIDRLNTPRENQHWANEKIVKFLQKNGGGERIGVYILGSSLRVLQDLTGDGDKLARAVARLHPEDGRRITADVTVDSSGDARTDAMIADSLSRLEDFEVTDRVSATRDALEAIARHLASVPGRKNLIWVSTAFPLVIIRSHEVIDYSRDVNRAARVLNDANIAVYPVDPRGLPGAMAYGYVTAPEHGPSSAGCKGPCVQMAPDQVRGPQAGLDTMNTLAGLTGGRAFYNTNGLEESMLQAVEDSRVSYVLGFYAPEGSFDDRFHKLQVRVARKGVEVRARTGYFASRSSLEGAFTHSTLQQLLDASLDATAVGITAGAQPDTAQSGHFLVHVVVDLRNVQLDHQNGRATGAVDVSLFAESAKSVRTITRKIDIAEEQMADALAAGVIVDNSLPVEAASREIRVVAQDRASGAAGSVRIPIGR